MARKESAPRDMKNVEISVDGDIMTITVDLSVDFGVSASGKSVIIASTVGNQPVVPGRPEIIGMNIYRKV